MTVLICGVPELTFRSHSASGWASYALAKASCMAVSFSYFCGSVMPLRRISTGTSGATLAIPLV